uniref:Uncharacterized protein n=1 Tax=Anguilla anguilla TaxID=7936 RepID=A0A0E9W9P7_ANGAN
MISLHSCGTSQVKYLHKEKPRFRSTFCLRFSFICSENKPHTSA